MNIELATIIDAMGTLLAIWLITRPIKWMIKLGKVLLTIFIIHQVLVRAGVVDPGKLSYYHSLIFA